MNHQRSTSPRLAPDGSMIVYTLTTSADAPAKVANGIDGTPGFFTQRMIATVSIGSVARKRAPSAWARTPAASSHAGAGSYPGALGGGGAAASSPTRRETRVAVSVAGSARHSTPPGG